MENVLKVQVALVDPGEELGADGSDLQHVFPERQAGAILLRRDRISQARTTASDRLHRLRGLKIHAHAALLEVAVGAGLFPVRQAESFGIPYDFAIPHGQDAAQFLVCR